MACLRLMNSKHTLNDMPWTDRVQAPFEFAHIELHKQLLAQMQGQFPAAGLSGQGNVVGVPLGGTGKSPYDYDPLIAGTVLDSQALKNDTMAVTWANSNAPLTMGANMHHSNTVSYTHMTLPTIYSV